MIESGRPKGFMRSAGYWIAVASRVDSLERLESQEAPWWCMPREARLGDRILIYRTKSVSPKWHGLFAEFRLKGILEDELGECRKYGSFSGFHGIPVKVTLERMRFFSEPIPIYKLRDDPEIAYTAAVRRNFQGTFFSLEPKVYSKIDELLRQGG